jgi:hypothetical protein
MPIRSTGPISFSDINQELGYVQTRQISLGDAEVRSLLARPTGAVSMSDALGKSRGYLFNQTIAANTANYNLKNAATAAGWDQVTPLIATITINAGVYVYSVSTGSYAFDTGATFPAGTTLALINNGIILGMGGAGGTGGGRQAFTALAVDVSSGTAGGPALRAQYTIDITNNGSIAGGGGGGGGGGSMYG